MSVVRRSGQGHRLLAKGANERILDIATSWRGPDGPAPLDAAARAEIVAAETDMASRGLRVIALAARPADGPDADGGGATAGAPAGPPASERSRGGGGGGLRSVGLCLLVIVCAAVACLGGGRGGGEGGFFVGLGSEDSSSEDSSSVPIQCLRCLLSSRLEIV